METSINKAINIPEKKIKISSTITRRSTQKNVTAS